MAEPDALRTIRGGRTGRPEGFELAYVDAAGEETRRPLAEALTVRLENARPVRRFPSYRGQRNYPGLYYAATLDAHVEYESWLERDEAMALDHDPDVVGFAAQPFWLFWPDTDRVRSHAPDFFARTADGGAIVIDCRPKHRVKPRDAVAFAATEQACAEVGWRFRLVTGHDPIWLANVRWLAGYRHPRHAVQPVVARLLEIFTQPRALVEGAAWAGDLIAVLPVVYHLLWSRRLHADLSERLEAATVVRTVP